MAVAGARDGLKPAARQVSADAPSVELLIRELGGTQHLDRERAILRLRASLRDSGVACTRRRTVGSIAACEQQFVVRCRQCPDHRVRAATAHLQKGFVDRLAPEACMAERGRGEALRRGCEDCSAQYCKITHDYMQHRSTCNICWCRFCWSTSKTFRNGGALLLAACSCWRTQKYGSGRQSATAPGYLLSNTVLNLSKACRSPSCRVLNETG